MPAATAVEATFTSTTWSSPTLLNELSSAMTPWISCAFTIATSTSRISGRLASFSDRVPRHPVGDCEDGAEIVGRVAPLGREPGVVEIEPADQRADVERGLHRIEFMRRAGYACTVRHQRARHERAEQARAGGILQRFKAAAQRVEQALLRGVESKFAVDAVVAHVVDDVDQHRIRIRPCMRREIMRGQGRSSSGTKARFSGPV